MGYTHYFKQTKEFSPESWETLKKKAKSIIRAAKASGIAIAGSDGTGKPIMDENKIVLNGLDDDGHETFSVPRVPRDNFEYCKTAQKPYDVVVTAILFEAQKLNDGFIPSSDGGLEAIKNELTK